MNAARSPRRRAAARRHHAVAGADELLELPLGLAERRRHGIGRLGAELRAIAGELELQDGALGEPREERLGRRVEPRGVVLVDRAADLVRVIGDGGLELLLGEQHHAGIAEEIERAEEAVERQELGDVRALALVRHELRRDAQLGLELRGGGDLDLLEVGDRALGERGEAAEGLDLDVEEVDADGVVGGRREEIKQAAADRELAAVLDLLDALVPAVDELDANSSRSMRSPFLSVRPCGRSSGSGIRSASAAALATITGGAWAAVASSASAASSSASMAAMRRPIRCGGGARCER